ARPHRAVHAPRPALLPGQRPAPRAAGHERCVLRRCDGLHDRAVSRRLHHPDLALSHRPAAQAMSRRRRLTRLGVLSILIAALVAAGTLGGMMVGLNAFSETRHTTAFGSLDSRVVPDLDGHVSVYVPLVDWRVHLLEYNAPARIE